MSIILSLGLAESKSLDQIKAIAGRLAFKQNATNKIQCFLDFGEISDKVARLTTQIAKAAQ
jgi:hypothetical protein